MVSFPDIERFDGKQRFAIGVAPIVLMRLLPGSPVRGARLRGAFLLVAIWFLGAALLPAFVNQVEAEEWSDISTVKQLGILWVSGVGSLIMFFVLNRVVSSLTELLG